MSLGSNVVPVLSGGFRLDAIRSGRSDAAFVYAFALLTLLTELVIYWMGSHAHHNIWVTHLYTLTAYILLMLTFALWQKEDGKSRTGGILSPRVLRASILVYVFFWLASKWTFEKWDEPGTYTLAVCSFVFILLSLVMLYRQVSSRDRRDKPLLRDFRFWITVGVLSYFSGSVVEFLAISVLINLPREAFLKLWTLQWVISSLSNAAYAYGFLCLTRRPAA